MKVVKLGNAQKTVFTLLVGILLLEFGSLTKVQKIWQLAFTAPAQDQQQKQSSSPDRQPGHDVPAVASATIPTHPGGLRSV